MRTPLSRSARRQVSGTLAVLWVLLAAPVSAQQPLHDLARRAGLQIVAEGQSGRRLRDTSIRQFPWQQMSADSRRQVRKIVDRCAQYRRLPEFRYPVDPATYRYLVNHPDVAVSTWRAMQISQVNLWQVGPREFETTAPDGSGGRAVILYRDAEQCLVLCDGTYRSPLLPRPITASALLWLRYRLQETDQGETFVRQKLDVFLSFPSAAMRAMAVLASPITNMMIDRNAFEVSLYARMMSQAVTHDPEWVRQIAWRLDGVDPRRRQELADLTQLRNRTLPADDGRDRTAAVRRQPDSESDSRAARMVSTIVIHERSLPDPNEQSDFGDDGPDSVFLPSAETEAASSRSDSKDDTERQQREAELMHLARAMATAAAESSAEEAVDPSVSCSGTVSRSRPPESSGWRRREESEKPSPSR